MSGSKVWNVECLEIHFLQHKVNSQWLQYNSFILNPNLHAYLDDLFDLWYVELKHVLYTSLQSQRGTGTSSTGSLHGRDGV